MTEYRSLNSSIGLGSNTRRNSKPSVAPSVRQYAIDYACCITQWQL